MAAAAEQVALRPETVRGGRLFRAAAEAEATITGWAEYPRLVATGAQAALRVLRARSPVAVVDQAQPHPALVAMAV